MAGIQPPTSSSRVRTRPSSSSAVAAAAAASPMMQRPPISITSPNNNVIPKTSPPLESVVIRPNNNNDDNAATNNTVKNTNVQVCVRIRPLLSSDFKNTIDNNNAGSLSSVQSTPRSKPTSTSSRSNGKGFARDTTASSSRASSGLVTPSSSATAASGLRRPTSISKSSTAKKSAIPPPAPSDEEQQLHTTQSTIPSWQTHTTDKQRITQSIHTTSHTTHHNPDRLADYTFDRVYSHNENTNVLYEESISNVVQSVVEGYHGSVFAYGQTNSGKTHTMTGSRKESGVIRQAVQDIFQRISSQTSSSANREYLVRVSYLEIYNEQIYDLLALPAPAGSSPSKFKTSLQHHHLPPSTAVRIFESRTEGVVVRGLREEIVTCPEDVFALLDSGDVKRKVGSTGMNKTSSRSHSVFRLVLESRESRGTSSKSSSNVGSAIPSSNSSINSDTDSVATGRSSITQSLGTAVKGPVRISSLSLVDLAGSESLKATGSTGVRAKEGQFINKSLLTLGHVVHKLSEMSKNKNDMAPKEHIPYRDSKLTRLLQPSLGANAQTCIICNISPTLSNLEESHNTLKFAMRAKKIQQHARITEVADEKTLLRSYREEIEELKRQLKDAKAVAQQQQSSSQVEQTPRSSDSDGLLIDDSSDEEDQDDRHVLVSAIANLESLILKAGAKSGRKAVAVNDGTNSTVASTVEGDESLPSRRSLDATLKKAESDDVSSPSSANLNKVSLATPTVQHVDGEDDDPALLEELHRIQGMLGSVMTKKRRNKTAATSSSVTKRSTPERDAEVERLRMQLQSQEVTSTMRKADSSFLQSQLNEKEEILKEVSVLLEALEKRQLELENENKQMKEDLTEAAHMIEDGDDAKKLLEQQLAEKDKEMTSLKRQLAEKDEQLASREHQLIEKANQMVLLEQQLAEKDGQMTLLEQLAEKNEQLSAMNDVIIAPTPLKIETPEATSKDARNQLSPDTPRFTAFVNYAMHKDGQQRVNEEGVEIQPVNHGGTPKKYK